MFKIPNFCFIHSLVIFNIDKKEETWCKSISGTKIGNSDFKRIKYEIRYKCKWCDKSKFEIVYHDDITKERKLELDTWIKENGEIEAKK